MTTHVYKKNVYFPPKQQSLTYPGNRFFGLVGALSAKYLIHPLRVLTVFSQKALTAGSDFLFGPNYIGIRGCFKLNLSANMFYRVMI